MDTQQTMAGGRRVPMLTTGDDVPLHPALTDVPVATFSLAPIFDAAALATGSEVIGGAGLWTGIAGAVWTLPTAVTGLLDWLHAERGSEVRRIGTRHAILNVTALGLVVGSLVTRGFRARPTVLSTALSATAGGIVTYSSHLGGIMVYQQGSRVKPAEELGVSGGEAGLSATETVEAAAAEMAAAAATEAVEAAGEEAGAEETVIEEPTTSFGDEEPTTSFGDERKDDTAA